MLGNSLAVQWLGHCAFTAEGAGSIPGWGSGILQAVGRLSKKKKKSLQCSDPFPRPCFPAHSSLCLWSAFSLLEGCSPCYGPQFPSHPCRVSGDCRLTGSFARLTASPQSSLCLNVLWLWRHGASFSAAGYTCSPFLWLTPSSSFSPTLCKYLFFLYFFPLWVSSLSEVQPSFVCLMSWKLPSLIECSTSGILS